MDVIEIVTAIDKGYASQTLTMLKSLHRHHGAGEVRVTIYVDGMEAKERSEFAGRAARLAPGLELNFLEAPAVLNDGDQPYEGFAYISKVTMLRLQMPEILPKELHKVLYLDVDLVVMGSLRGLWSGAPCKGSWNTSDSAGICARSTLKYDSEWLTNELLKRPVVNRTSFELFSARQFNAGVLLLDLDVLRRNEFTLKIRQMLRDSSVNDQDALNLYAMGMHAEMAPEYNAMVYFADGAGKNFAGLEAPMIVHFDGPLKPWACKGAAALKANARFWAEIAEEWPPAGCESKVDGWLASTSSRHSSWDMSVDRAAQDPPASTDKDLTWAWNALPRGGAAGADVLVVYAAVTEPPQDVVDNAERLVKLSAPQRVQAFCGSSSCVKALSAVGAQAELIWLHELAMPFSLRRWFQNHTVHKLRAGAKYARSFQQAVVLAALYARGGLYVDLNARVLESASKLPAEAMQGKWALGHEDGWQGLWSACRFPSHSRELFDAASRFAAAGADAGASLEEVQSGAASSVPSWNSAWGSLSSLLAAPETAADASTAVELVDVQVSGSAEAFPAVAGLQILPRFDGEKRHLLGAKVDKHGAWGRLLAMQGLPWEFRSRAFVVGSAAELPQLRELASSDLRDIADQVAIPEAGSLEQAAELAAAMRSARVVATAHPPVALMASGMGIPAVLVTGLVPTPASDVRQLSKLVWVQDVSDKSGILASMPVDTPPENPGASLRRKLRFTFFQQNCGALEFYRMYTDGEERADVLAAMDACH